MLAPGADYPLGEGERRLLESSPRLARAMERLVEAAGGPALCRTVHECCQGLARTQPRVLELSREGDDTVLMQLCARRAHRHAPDLEKQRRLQLAQINAFLRLYADRQPGLLAARNRAGTSALDLAALTGKTEAAAALALACAAAGSDPNAAPEGGGGHTVLHLLARKGDDAADTLEALLGLRREDGSRLLRLDVVNAGRKTPLDVAVACRELFSVGPDRAVYDRTIAAFHAVIQEDAREMFDCGGRGADAAGHMTFRNF